MADAVATDVNPPPSGRGTPQLRTLLFTDICDSTDIVHLLGYGPAGDTRTAPEAWALELPKPWGGPLMNSSAEAVAPRRGRFQRRAERHSRPGAGLGP